MERLGSNCPRCDFLYRIPKQVPDCTLNVLMVHTVPMAVAFVSSWTDDEHRFRKVELLCSNTRSGAGRYLVQSLQREALSDGVGLELVSVPSAQRFYEKLEFRVVNPTRPSTMHYPSGAP